MRSSHWIRQPGFFNALGSLRQASLLIAEARSGGLLSAARLDELLNALQGALDKLRSIENEAHGGNEAARLQFELRFRGGRTRPPRNRSREAALGGRACIGALLLTCLGGRERPRTQRQGDSRRQTERRRQSPAAPDSALGAAEYGRPPCGVQIGSVSPVSVTPTAACAKPCS
jgi:hypothetical protein